MPAEPIPFPITSAPGRNVHDSAGRLINSYAEQLVNGARAPYVWRRAPGLLAWLISSYSGWRGAIVVDSLLYVAMGTHVLSYTTNGIEALLGSEAGTKKLIWARNDKATPDVVFVDPDNGAFQVTTTPSVISYPDVNVGAPNSVCFLDGYFFFTHGDGTCVASALNDTPINPLDFVKLDGNDLGLLRAIPFGELYLFGSHTIQPWQNTAEPTGFPFSRVKVIPVGLLGRYAISGYEKGFGRGIVFVANDRTVKALNGYDPVKISTPDVDRAIGSFIDAGNSVDLIEMFPYSVAGKACIVMQTPQNTAPAWTWVFDTDSLGWHERASSSTGLTSWRAHDSVFFNNLWLTGDSQSNYIAQITETTQQEIGADLPLTLYSGPVTKFPNRMRVNQMTLDIARGVGMATGSDPVQTNPRCYISWSDDGGMNWSNPVERTIGRQMTSPFAVRVNRCGQTKDQGRRWRITVYDPVDVEITGGSQSDEIRNY